MEMTKFDYSYDLSYGVCRMLEATTGRRNQVHMEISNGVEGTMGMQTSVNPYSLCYVDSMETWSSHKATTLQFKSTLVSTSQQVRQSHHHIMTP